MSIPSQAYPAPSEPRDPAGTSRHAFATFMVMNSSFLAGALTVAYGLRRQGSRADLVCLVTPEVGAECRDALSVLYHRVIEVPSIRIPHRRAQSRQHVSYVFTRLHALRLGSDGSLGGGYERVVLLDADVLPLRHFDHLFTLRPPAGIPNERKEHLVELDAAGRQIAPPEGQDGWVWHRVYGSTCPHGRPIPREITDRVMADPTNLGVNGSVILVEPSEREFRAIMEDLELPETRRRVEDTWEWPDQQYLTARWSGAWTSIDARFSGLAGYPSLDELCGTHYAGVKPWHFRRPDALRRFARYEDFRAWYAAFAAMVRDDFPGLRRYRTIRTIIDRIAAMDLPGVRAADDRSCDMKMGIVGYGNLGAAIAKGLAAAKAEVSISAYDKSEERRHEAKRNGVTAAPSLEALITDSELLLIAVKPQDLSGLLAAIGKGPARRRIVSIVAGRSIAGFEAACGTREIARLMPTIAATVGQSYVGVSFHDGASPEFREAALAIARSIGVAVVLEERLLAAVTGIASSGIAFVLAFLHAMAMGGVHAGLDYRRALGAAVQTARGAVALLEGGELGATGSPVDLLTKVTSPAGTTIEGIYELEEGAFTAAVMRAVKAAADRAVELEREAR